MNTVVNYLFLVQVVEYAICAHYNDIIVEDAMLSIISIVRQLVPHPTLERKVESMFLLLRAIYFL